MQASVRALRGSDIPAARALIANQFGGTPYEARILEHLEVARHGNDAECVGLVEGDEPRGLVLSGSVAGAHDIVKIHAVVARDLAVCQILAAAMRDAAPRMVVYEVPDDAPFLGHAAAMTALGYREEGRVADFVRDGVDLIVMVWRRTT
ncbi:MAG: hypothetical protein ABIT20_25715 [Gemmatimonadaceae bacterium]